MEVSVNLRRREILAGLIGVGSAAWVRPVLSAPSPLKVGVVGGGIVGASIALHLARAGAQVMVFEKLGPALGATQ